MGDAWRTRVSGPRHHQDLPFRDGTQWAVFVIEDGRARRRVVNAPRRNGVEALVESGLSEGERVIVYPPEAVRDGARVELR